MILLTYGTRPEWIKIKPLIDEMVKNNIPFKTLFTGQHKDMVHEDADYNIKMVNRCENRLNSVMINCLEIPDEYFNGITHVLIQGDTTSALSLALNAFNRKIKIIHLEAGLRTNDFENPYPEEGNRQLISRISDINLCPTTLNNENLISEGVPTSKNFVVGNTGLDNLLKHKNMTTYDDIVLVTLHRRENHDNIEKWFRLINELANEYKNIKFILPIHPNPEVKKHEFILTNVEVVTPLRHSDLLDILIKCKLVITDSGGLQEECSFLNKKCLVCRTATERPESIGKTTIMVNLNNLKEQFKLNINEFYTNHESPFGDGYSSSKICQILKKNIYGI
jgi:UDP-N-acetylglucosamine 2-epimerase (non-hydrolysing)